MARLLTRRMRNWDVALVTWAADVRGRPFEWGTCDCAMLVREAVTVMYGLDPFDVKSWSSLKTALGVHQKTGGVDVMLVAVGGRKIHPAFMQTGDILTAPPEEDTAPITYAGVIVGADVVGVRQDDEVRLVPKSMYPNGMGVYVWRLPHE